MGTEERPEGLHQTTNYGCAGGVCENRYANVMHAQGRAMLLKIGAAITGHRAEDPSGYYQGDLDELLDCYRRLAERLRKPIS